MKKLFVVVFATLAAVAATAAIKGAPFLPEADARFHALESNPVFVGVVSAPQLVVVTSASPLSNAACTAGRIVWDASYVYVCTASGAWKRAALTGGY